MQQNEFIMRTFRGKYFVSHRTDNNLKRIDAQIRSIEALTVGGKIPRNFKRFLRYFAQAYFEPYDIPLIHPDTNKLVGIIMNPTFFSPYFVDRNTKCGLEDGYLDKGQLMIGMDFSDQLIVIDTAHDDVILAKMRDQPGWMAIGTPGCYAKIADSFDQLIDNLFIPDWELPALKEWYEDDPVSLKLLMDSGNIDKFGPCPPLDGQYR
jgi:hypothetical protein